MAGFRTPPHTAEGAETMINAYGGKGGGLLSLTVEVKEGLAEPAEDHDPHDARERHHGDTCLIKMPNATEGLLFGLAS